MRFLRSPGGVALLALVIGILAAIRLLAVFDWDPTVFTAFGEEATAITEYAEEELGREVLTRPHQGHDGKFFFVQATDPWVLDPERAASLLDRPIYRAQRMFYPLLAGGADLFPAEVIIWALPVVNVVMLAAGSWAVASIARRHGAPAWIGLAFVLNIGLLSELFIDGAGVVAFALACLGAWALEEDRTLVASAAFVGAVLSREVMTIFVALIAMFWLIRRRVIPWAISLPAAAAIVGWIGYLQLRIDAVPSPNQVSGITPVPFKGVVESFTSGEAVPIDYAVILLFLGLMVVVPLRAWRSDVYLTWGAVGFALLAPFLTLFVWQKSFDISRALAPLVTVFVLELFIARGKRGLPRDGHVPIDSQSKSLSTFLNRKTSGTSVIS